jgi:nicotinamide riboside kinase
MKIVNLFAGPGAGKSTTAAALFAELKYRGVNCEYITEYAKDATWEKRGPKVFQAQEYIFGKQHFRVARVIEDVDLIITDSPVLMGICYMPKDFPLPSLRSTIKEAHDLYNSLNIFIARKDATGYNPKGRNQTPEEALAKDAEIRKMLTFYNVEHHVMFFNRHTPQLIINKMFDAGWAADLPQLFTDDPLHKQEKAT